MAWSVDEAGGGGVTEGLGSSLSSRSLGSVGGWLGSLVMGMGAGMGKGSESSTQPGRRVWSRNLLWPGF